MMTADYRIDLADWNRDQCQLTELRTEVFVQEQQVPPELEIDDLDPRCQHFKSENGEGRVIATARLLPDGYIGRMCVHRSERGRGVGSSLLTYVIQHAARQGFRSLQLHAQLSAVSFYQRFGFVVDGEIFVEAGIDHQHMSLNLDNYAIIDSQTGAS